MPQHLCHNDGASSICCYCFSFTSNFPVYKDDHFCISVLHLKVKEDNSGQFVRYDGQAVVSMKI
jgi:hypothetical protein